MPLRVYIPRRPDLEPYLRPDGGILLRDVVRDRLIPGKDLPKTYRRFEISTLNPRSMFYGIVKVREDVEGKKVVFGVGEFNAIFVGYRRPPRRMKDDFDKKTKAMDKAREWGDRIPIGIFYKNELEPTFSERLSKRIPFYLKDPPAKQRIHDENGNSTADLAQFFHDLRTT